MVCQADRNTRCASSVTARQLQGELDSWTLSPGVESWGQVRVVRADDSYVEGTLVSHLDEVDSKRAVNAFSAVDEQHNSLGFDGSPAMKKPANPPRGRAGKNTLCYAQVAG